MGVLNSFTRAAGAAQRVLSLMDNLPVRSSHCFAVSVSWCVHVQDINPDSGEEIVDVRGELRLEHVNFHYQSIALF